MLEIIPKIAGKVLGAVAEGAKAVQTASNIEGKQATDNQQPSYQMARQQRLDQE